ncbi:GPI transamidase component PIG-T [Cryptotermes secundus]|uniref:GPI transamidase component PIG-T n=1 Tax=Cryptotermes secundus TaxID=105785 RepID=A0A2J7QF02_9NEOP|nr:GPI transamidase component PIG-T [Cryptotermes secundus]XP_023714108.1 GPI transamidase component PIG-T [Cryptotermes secundus]XP_033608783.1 GPI transamidase component PIG-T [Cryptotermes secundus]PNF27160.1 GPI transamidase component PIG-T [Cryptotermes secundus]PNF27161.1 GPI transamidase component PIG-T [Cryptotermes secundus]
MMVVLHTIFSGLLCLQCISSVICTPQKDYFDEELLLKPLPSGHVYAYFQFTTLWDVDFEATSFQHCHLFPRALGEIVGRYNVQELHISLTEGLWRHETWGYPVHDAAPGAELWAWFKESTKNIDKTWKELAGALSGLLCVSFNFVDASNSLNPEFTFRPAGIVSSGAVNSSYLRYSTLPREIVCTENLTPWKKLLPCDAKKGLSTLLNAGHIHNTNYHSLGLHLRPVCRDTTCSQMSVELRQTVSLVYDMVILGTGNQDWSIKKLFGIGLSGACPLATMSNIYIDIALNETGAHFQLTPTPPAVITSTRGGHKSKFAVYDIKALDIDGMFNIAAVYSSSRVYGVNIPPVLFANRYIIGYGQERGGIVTKLHNGHWQALDVVYLENIPWFIPLYLHTLKIVANGKEIKPLLKRFIPGKARARPYYLEVALRLPARSITEISLEFDYVFLKWQEYPPDANHGFYIGAAVITSLLPVGRNYTGLPQDGSTITSSFNASRDGYLVQLRTETLIITMPTPDFSMPYNVICLTCTVIALAFGPLHNITTKRLRLKNKEQNYVIRWFKSKLTRSSEMKEKQS